jgi:hypothetical protein
LAWYTEQSLKLRSMLQFYRPCRLENLSKRFSFAVTMLSTSQLYCHGVVVPVADELRSIGTSYDTFRRL